MTKRSFPEALFDALASLRLAVIVMVTLGSTCAIATFYESKHGTAAVQRVFYKTPWFAFILVTLGANIFCAMMKRYPFKKHHVGFVLAHIGILTLLTGSLVSLHYGLDSNMALYEGESTDRVSLLQKALEVTLPEEAARGTFDVDFDKDPPRPGYERRFPVPGSHAVLVAERYEPHVVARESYEEASDGHPALHFVLDNPFAKEDGWLDPLDPDKKELSFGPATVSFHLGEDSAKEKEPRNEIRFLLARDGSLRYLFLKKEGGSRGGRVVLDKSEETPWMGMTVRVDRLLSHAQASRSITPAPLPERDELLMPAVEVHLEGPKGRSSSEWLLWTEARRISWGGAVAGISYRAPEVQVPFRVTLLKFNSDKYPGSNMPATYESDVRVEDPERGSFLHHISMNHPLHHRGYIFFQASFVEGQPMMSIFSVARAPGLPLVYSGVTLIAAGVAWMFYLKPLLARRQAQEALAARMKRETENAQKTAPVRRPSPAEPASSGA